MRVMSALLECNWSKQQQRKDKNRPHITPVRLRLIQVLLADSRAKAGVSLASVCLTASQAIIRDKNFTVTRYSSCKQKSPKKPPTPLTLSLSKAITGVHAGRAKNSLFAMAVIKAAALRQPSMTPPIPKLFISVAVSSQRMAFCVTEATTPFDAFAPPFLLRLDTDRYRFHHDRDRD